MSLIVKFITVTETEIVLKFMLLRQILDESEINRKCL